MFNILNLLSKQQGTSSITKPTIELHRSYLKLKYNIFWRNTVTNNTYIENQYFPHELSVLNFYIRVF